MNIRTIYDSRNSESVKMVKALLHVGFEEVGYLVRFQPKKSRADILYWHRQITDAAAVMRVAQIFEESFEEKIPRGRDDLPEYDSHHVYLGRLGNPKGYGVMDFSSGYFHGLEVYAAESFAHRLAEFLEEWHENKRDWICNENTKMRFMRDETRRGS